MAHGGYGKRRVAERKPHVGRRSKGIGVEKKPKPKSVSLKNHIRSIERMLRKELPHEVREAQEKKLEGLQKQQEIHTRLALERKIFLRDRKIKFFERRKIERRIRRLEKLQRASSVQAQDTEIAEQLSKLKEDLEYVRFFPKTEKYVALFTGNDDSDIVDRRNGLRKQIKANLVAAAASGKDLEETASEDDGLFDLSEDDFFLAGTSSDEAEADDEWTDKSLVIVSGGWRFQEFYIFPLFIGTAFTVALCFHEARTNRSRPRKEPASSTSGKAASGMSSDEKNQRQISARALMPPPRPPNNSVSNSVHAQSRFGASSSKNSWMQRSEISTSSNASGSISGSSSKLGGSSDTRTGHSSNLSSNSDAHKSRRKRRPKKKKQQA